MSLSDSWIGLDYGLLASRGVLWDKTRSGYQNLDLQFIVVLMLRYSYSVLPTTDPT